MQYYFEDEGKERGINTNTYANKYCNYSGSIVMSISEVSEGWEGGKRNFGVGHTALLALGQPPHPRARLPSAEHQGTTSKLVVCEKSGSQPRQYHRRGGLKIDNGFHIAHTKHEGTCFAEANMQVHCYFGRRTGLDRSGHVVPSGPKREPNGARIDPRRVTIRQRTTQIRNDLTHPRGARAVTTARVPAAPAARSAASFRDRKLGPPHLLCPKRAPSCTGSVGADRVSVAWNMGLGPGGPSGRRTSTIRQGRASITCRVIVEPTADRQPERRDRSR